MPIDGKRDPSQFGFVSGMPGILMLAAAVFAVVGQAQSSGTTAGIHGIVTDEKGVTVRGAVVVLSRRPVGALATAFAPQSLISDSNGMFVFRNLPAGLYVGCAWLAGSRLLNPCE